jgi:hypothetical protein
MHTHSVAAFLFMLDLLDGATSFGAKREMESTMNGRPIRPGSTQNVRRKKESEKPSIIQELL